MSAIKPINSRSEKNLEGVHPALQRIIRRADKDSPIAFVVIEGRRTLERQKELYRTGKSQTMRSRHLTGHAVDIVPVEHGRITWNWNVFHKLAIAIKKAAQAEKVPIEWGGDWRTFKDGPHWQLPWDEFPIEAPK